MKLVYKELQLNQKEYIRHQTKLRFSTLRFRGWVRTKDKNFGYISLYISAIYCILARFKAKLGTHNR